MVFQTFAVGALSSCAGDPNGLGSLQEIATLTGGSCFEIDDPTDLPDSIVPAVIQSRLISLELSVDGQPFVDISAELERAASGGGAGQCRRGTSLVPGLAPGIHELCVRANGSDGGGAGSVTECIEVTVATIDLAPADGDQRARHAGPDAHRHGDGRGRSPTAVFSRCHGRVRDHVRAERRGVRLRV